MRVRQELGSWCCSMTIPWHLTTRCGCYGVYGPWKCHRVTKSSWPISIFPYYFFLLSTSVRGAFQYSPLKRSYLPLKDMNDFSGRNQSNLVRCCLSCHMAHITRILSLMESHWSIVMSNFLWNNLFSWNTLNDCVQRSVFSSNQRTMGGKTCKWYDCALYICSIHNPEKYLWLWQISSSRHWRLPALSLPALLPFRYSCSL